MMVKGAMVPGPARPANPGSMRLASGLVPAPVAHVRPAGWSPNPGRFAGRRLGRWRGSLAAAPSEDAGGPDVLVIDVEAADVATVDMGAGGEAAEAVAVGVDGSQRTVILEAEVVAEAEMTEVRLSEPRPELDGVRVMRTGQQAEAMAADTSTVVTDRDADATAAKWATQSDPSEQPAGPLSAAVGLTASDAAAEDLPGTTAAAAAAVGGGSAPSPSTEPSSAPRRAPVVDLPLQALVRNAASGGAAASPSTAAGGGGRPRPFPPPLDLPRLQEALLGEPSIGPVFQELFALSRNRHNSNNDATTTSGASAGPLLYAPRFPRPAGAPPPSELPLLVYLPGIDGTGLAAYRQFPRLAGAFDLRGVFLPPEDRTPFEGVVEALAQQIEDEAAGMDPSRPIYLLGESFGGLLALALAQKLNCVDRLVLVNPATSFDRSPWPALGPLLPALPPELYRLLPVALSPLLSNPLAMAAHAIASPADPPTQQAVDLLYGLLDLIPELSSLRVVLPPDTLSWRLELLRQGAEAVNPSLRKVRQRVLLLAGELDLVIPSASEVPRLARALPRATPRVLRGRSHALLQEAGVDLLGILQEEDFYVSRRRLTRPNTPPGGASASTSTSSPGRRPKPAPGGAAFGTTGPIELPTPGEIRRAAKEAGLDTLRTMVSPVFLSTDGPTGRVQLGLGGIPLPPPATHGSSRRPLLFVGNHQLFAADMPLMIEHFLRERGQLLRGLAHPMALGAVGQASPSPESSGRFGRFLETFGAVPVSGKALHSLLAAGEPALLYPGGVREALKLKDERYALIWPSRPEFVRMACKFGATIVPFAGVGAEDSLEVLADRRDLLAAPLVGEWLRRASEQSVAARRGVSYSEDIEESFVPPLVGPRPPARFYFLFGAPIETDPRVAGDRAAVQELYGKVRTGVEDCLSYLLRKREADPYKDLLPRLAYEASWGGRRQAPTFKP